MFLLWLNDNENSLLNLSGSTMTLCTGKVGWLLGIKQGNVTGTPRLAGVRERPEPADDVPDAPQDGHPGGRAHVARAAAAAAAATPDGGGGGPQVADGVLRLDRLGSPELFLLGAVKAAAQDL